MKEYQIVVEQFREKHPEWRSANPILTGLMNHIFYGNPV